MTKLMTKLMLAISLIAVVAGCGDIEWFPAAQTTSNGNNSGNSTSGGNTSGNPDSGTTATSFTPQCGKSAGTLVTSNAIKVTGVSGLTTISVSGNSNDKYAINGGDFVNVAGSVVAGDTVRVQHTAGSGVVTTTLTIGSTEYTFVTDSGSGSCS